MSFEKQIELAREKILGCTRPVILFDDDPDGLASYLLIYRMVHAGKGIAIKGSALNAEFAQKVNEYSPDLVIILDKPVVDQEFFDTIRTDCIWIDHHDVAQPKGVLYINPRTHQENIPTSSLCFDISQDDAWLAAIGIVADWQMPKTEILSQIQTQYPDLLPQDITHAPEALFTTAIGELARVFSFNLKGRSKDVLTSMKILSKINEPYELLDKKHPQAQRIMKKYEQHLGVYRELLARAKESVSEEAIIFTYEVTTTTFTPDLSNELLYLYPNKAILIARESSGSYKCSIRDNNRNIKEVLARVIEAVGGDGGGHEHACGAVVASEIFNEFVDEFKAELKRTKAKRS